LEEENADLDLSALESDSDLGDFGDLGDLEDEGGFSDSDEITTKLDLAQAYIEMGDNDGARSMLEEVVEAGNDEQKQQAQDLLSKI
jgi:pilus assembly protein FimV